MTDNRATTLSNNVSSLFALTSQLMMSKAVNRPAAKQTLVPVPAGLQLFQTSVLVLGAVGVVANGLVCVLLAQMQSKKRASTNLLILNQLALDLYTCAILVVLGSLYLHPVSMSGLGGKLLCKLFNNQLLVWIGLVGSVTGIVAITLERYVKIVFPMLHKKYFRQWMIYVSVVCCWLNGILMEGPSIWVKSDLVQGHCIQVQTIHDHSSQVVYGVFKFTWKFLLPFSVLVVCYAHILIVVRKSAKVHGTGVASGNTARASDVRIQMNIIKTMITITIFFFISWLPSQVCFFLVDIEYIKSSSSSFYVVWFSAMLLTFINICGNPFIYATQYDVMKARLKSIAARFASTQVIQTVAVPLGHDIATVSVRSL